MQPIPQETQNEAKKPVKKAANNPYGAQAGQYQKQQVETASPEQLMLMLFDGAIRFLVQAKKGLEAKDYEASNDNLQKAQRIIQEFICTLDFEIGGDVARELYRLYEYLHYRLVQANIKRDVSMVEEVLTHMRDLRKTWGEAVRIAKAEAANGGNVEASGEAAHDGNTSHA